MIVARIGGTEQNVESRLGNSSDNIVTISSDSTSSMAANVENVKTVMIIMYVHLRRN